ncbi:uncharacterized protein CTRU02_205827 [Colletotrichum truncatum]|uniref:Uncharacterized protein n=1 Tax=Colletotrichum truncatum TaxID=5467 RepID=A0ACC3Z540_COLTU|nr:uncharacterized protein CTRU02_04655 [Colletotrichum truncatum]KAF6795092.1 hypothetical protein CTRU02_04655 [Colletotrichum truncatum]
MTSQHSGAATLPKGFRYHDPDLQDPKTPEPSASNEELQPPSPPRPRFKLKRRVASNLTAPTSQFLASVATADVPIPSIEEPEAPGGNMHISSMTYPVIHNLKDLEDIGIQKIRGRRFSPPKTPAPGAAPSLSPRRYPNWSIDSAFSSGESTPECESSRPSTARSTQTSASIFSRFSLTSEDLQCISPETEASDHFNRAFSETADEVVEKPAKVKGKRRKAPWTKAMNDHLWATYLMYLQDPKVTPFRTGKSCIPPHGVCLRVAREAKRSWRGPKGARKSLNPKSGSNTPTVEGACTFLQWPHTCAATRAHLRDLCKLKAASSSARKSQFLPNSPTPFGRTATRYWNRKSTPARSPSVFSAHDMSMSLTISTSEAMQPQGPLAQLTKSTPEPVEEPMTEPFPPLPVDLSSLDVPVDERPRLGSPFMANSYGPSSSGALSAAISSMPQRQNQSLGHRRTTLQSPARLTRSRSNTQKRIGRPRVATHEPRKTKRPSLGSDLWAEPSPFDDAPKTPLRPEIEFSSTNSNVHDDLFVPRTSLSGLFTAPIPIPSARPDPTGPSLAPPSAPPARLGSPFPGSQTSFSFPNRFTQPEELEHGTIRRPFATVQQSVDGGTAPPRNLANRLAYIDDRLREFRRRDSNRRRSESPF